MTAHPGTIGVRIELILRVLDDLSRHRSLSDDETELLASVIQRTPQRRSYVKWTRELERELLRVAHRRSGIRAFAEKHEMTPNTAYSRLRVLRKKFAKSPPPDNRFKAGE